MSNMNQGNPQDKQTQTQSNPKSQQNSQTTSKVGNNIEKDEPTAGKSGGMKSEGGSSGSYSSDTNSSPQQGQNPRKSSNT